MSPFSPRSNFSRLKRHDLVYGKETLPEILAQEADKPDLGKQKHPCFHYLSQSANAAPVLFCQIAFWTLRMKWSLEVNPRTERVILLLSG